MTKNNEIIEPENNPSPQSETSEQDSAASTPESEVKTSEAPQEKQAATPPPATPQPKPVKQGNKGVKLATLAIVLSLFFGGGSVYLANQQAAMYKAEIAALKSELDQTKASLTQQIKAGEGQATSMVNNLKNQTETLLNQQHESLNSLQVALADIKGRRPNDWLLAEADYLVKLAGRKLFLDKDVESATRLMESADQRISALNDPSLVPLRKEMTQDIVTLKAVPLIDREGLAIRLTTLQELVDKLPLANAILPDAPVVEKAQVSEDINDWQENLVTSLKDFSEQFITFRTRDGNVIPLLSPKQHYYLKENIKGKLENAIRAIYTENGEVYQSSLKVANDWAQQFFKLDDANVEQFTQALTELGSKNIAVAYPVKLVSQKALADVINERLRRDITSMTLQEDEQ
jgi:uroporphyrin-3 C-methyltransferase